MEIPEESAEERESLRRRIAALTVDLERARLAAREVDRDLRESQRQALADAQADAELHLRKLKEESSEREARLLKEAERERGRVEEMRLELSEAQTKARDAASAQRLAQQAALQEIQKARTQAAKRERALTKEFAEREAQLQKTLEDDRLRFEADRTGHEARRLDLEGRLAALSRELEQTRAGAEETARRFRESYQKESAAAKERLEMTTKAAAEREAVLLDKCNDLSRRVAAMAVELEWARRGAQSAEHAFRESQGKSITAAQAEAAERAARRAAEGGGPGTES